MEQIVTSCQTQQLPTAHGVMDQPIQAALTTTAMALRINSLAVAEYGLCQDDAMVSWSTNTLSWRSPNVTSHVTSKSLGTACPDESSTTQGM